MKNKILILLSAFCLIGNTQVTAMFNHSDEKKVICEELLEGNQKKIYIGKIFNELVENLNQVNHLLERDIEKVLKKILNDDDKTFYSDIKKTSYKMILKINSLSIATLEKDLDELSENLISIKNAILKESTETILSDKYKACKQDEFKQTYLMHIKTVNIKIKKVERLINALKTYCFLLREKEQKLIEEFLSYKDTFKEKSPEKVQVLAKELLSCLNKINFFEKLYKKDYVEKVIILNLCKKALLYTDNSEVFASNVEKFQDFVSAIGNNIIKLSNGDFIRKSRISDSLIYTHLYEFGSDLIYSAAYELYNGKFNGFKSLNFSWDFLAENKINKFLRLFVFEEVIETDELWLDFNDAIKKISNNTILSTSDFFKNPFSKEYEIKKIINILMDFDNGALNKYRVEDLIVCLYKNYALNENKKIKKQNEELLYNTLKSLIEKNKQNEDYTSEDLLREIKLSNSLSNISKSRVEVMLERYLDEFLEAEKNKIKNKFDNINNCIEGNFIDLLKTYSLVFKFFNKEDIKDKIITLLVDSGTLQKVAIISRDIKEYFEQIKKRFEQLKKKFGRSVNKKLKTTYEKAKKEYEKYIMFEDDFNEKLIEMFEHVEGDANKNQENNKELQKVIKVFKSHKVKNNMENLKGISKGIIRLALYKLING